MNHKQLMEQANKVSKDHMMKVYFRIHQKIDNGLNDDIIDSINKRFETYTLYEEVIINNVDYYEIINELKTVDYGMTIRERINELYPEHKLYLNYGFIFIAIKIDLRPPNDCSCVIL